MSRITKKCPGTLLDIEFGNEVAEGIFQIILVQHIHTLPKYEVTLMIGGYLPDLVERHCTLRLSEDLQGEVQVLNIIPPPSPDRTKYKVNLQDPIWNNLKWFDQL